jgi:hypothetical protein
VLAVGLVPDGRHLHAVRRDELAGAQLGLGLVREAVAHAEGEFLKVQHGGKTTAPPEAMARIAGVRFADGRTPTPLYPKQKKGRPQKAQQDAERIGSHCAIASSFSAATQP